MSSRVFVHKKTSDKYVIMHLAIECTNERAEGRVVVYRKLGVPHSPVFVRDLKEFMEKFEEI